MRLSTQQRKMLADTHAAQSITVPSRLGADRTAKSLYRLGLVQMWRDANGWSHIAITPLGRSALTVSEQR